MLVKNSATVLCYKSKQEQERGEGRREERRKEKRHFPRKLLTDDIGSGSVDILAEHRY